MPGKLLSKSGADGMYLAAVSPSQRWPEGLGFCIKLESGDAAVRMRAAVVMSALRQLEILDAQAQSALAVYGEVKLTNYRGEEVGEVSICFRLAAAAKPALAKAA